MKKLIEFDSIEQLKIKKVLAKNRIEITDNDLILFEDRKVVKIIKDNKELLFNNNVIINS